MLFRISLLSLCSALLFWPCQAQGAVSLPAEESAATLPADASGPAQEALKTYQEGRHAKAVELAKPLAEKGNADALHLLGLASETGQGLEKSREKALEYYRKADEAGNKASAYRMSFILLASEDEKERTQARETLEKASRDDPAVAGRILGEAYLRGMLSKEPDFEKAALWWNTASEAGDIDSDLLLARLHEGQFGFADRKDLKKSLDFYSKAAGFGHGPAMVALASRLLSGDESIRNEAKGREWIKKAIEAKETSAYLALGDFEEHVKKDLKAAVAANERGRDAGQVDCMLRTAEAFLEGKGVEKDRERGLDMLEGASKAGSPQAHYRLAAAFLGDEEPNVLKGYGHLLAAAASGISGAQHDLALLYISGKLGAQDSAAGVAWLTRASQGGNALSQFTLASLYLEGNGVPQNFSNAGQLYALASNQGHAAATFALAQMHGKGIGTESNPVRAWALASLATERGAEDSAKYAEEVWSQLDDKQKAEAEKEFGNLKAGKAPGNDTAPAAEKPAEAPAAEKPAEAPAAANPAERKPVTATTEPVELNTGKAEPPAP